MTNSGINFWTRSSVASNRRISNRHRRALVVPLLLIVFGCSHSPPDTLTIATNWSSARCDDAANRLARAADPIHVRWIRVSPSEDPTRILDRPSPVDLVIGGPTASYERLAAQHRLRPIPAKTGTVPWLPYVWGTSGIGFLTSAWPFIDEGQLRQDDPGLADRVGLVDPRRDVNGILGARLGIAHTAEAWRTEYARLVRLASQARQVGRDAETVIRALDAKRIGVAPLELDRLNDFNELQAEGDPPIASVAIQGVGIPAKSRQPALARLAVEFLVDRGSIQASRAPRPGALLVPDLLGSTLVDAHSQLRDARIALAGRSDNARSLAWMTEAPPWPPASISRIREKPDGASLVAVLAEQVAPDPAARDWLVRSWNRTPRPIDGATLDELATAAEGRLAAEPRFREWLRSEWTAWARQRYRRVVRQRDDPRFSSR